MDKPIARGDQARAQIIQAAYRLFVSQGYHGTSMRQIAQEAGIALGGIYNHFPNKDALFAGVLRAYHPLMEMLPEMESIQADSTEKFVRAAAHQFIAHLEGRQEFLNLMFVEFVEFKAVHVPALMADFMPMAFALAQRFEAKPGELRPMPAPVRVRAFLGLFFSYVLTDIALHNFPGYDQSFQGLDQFVDIFLNGILAKGTVA